MSWETNGVVMICFERDNLIKDYKLLANTFVDLMIEVSNIKDKTERERIKEDIEKALKDREKEVKI